MASGEVSSGQYKLDRRCFHRSQVIGSNLYLWGGGPPGMPQVHDNDMKRKLTSQVQIFNIISGKWDTKPTKGKPPLAWTGYSCSSLNNNIYYFGGHCGHSICYHNSLTELDTSSLTWTEISPTDDRRPVMKRGFGDMILTESGGVHCLLVIGGIGTPPSIYLPQTHYIPSPGGRVRTNEQNLYNISTDEWIVPDISGQCMPSNHGFIMESIHNTRAVIFGGAIEGGSTFSNTIYIVDIINNTLHWQTITKPDLAVHWPEETWAHASSIITGSISPMLVIIGGRNKDKKTLKDFWIMDINKTSWTKINLPNSVTERYGHSLSTYMKAPHRVCLIIVGGTVKFGLPITDPNIAMIIELVLNDGQWSVDFVLDSNGMTLTDNYQQSVLTEGRKEQQQNKSSQDNLSVKETVLQPNYQGYQERLLKVESQQDRQQVLNDGQWSVDFVLDSNGLTLTDNYQQSLLTEGRKEQQQNKSSQDNLSVKEIVLQPNYQGYQERLLKVESQQDRQQGELQEVKSERDRYQRSNLHLLQQIQRTEQARQDIEQQSQEYRRQLQDCQRQLQESQETVRSLQQQLEQLRSQQGQPHWVVGREEVTMTHEVLGGGSYGEVKVAMFRGLRVAAKSLHGIIISDYTRDLFSREMEIASRVRHPNLVQFIGATRVGTPIILTEIMTTSLYKELQKKALTQPQIFGISQDVASALNYLHLWKPNPIIHRDVSSPNVLLEPSVGDSFKAKVADYGAANLQQQANTDMPGNPAYAAPESRYPDDHTPAMDVYSYSVLLMEMILHYPPAMTVIEREQQASRVSWSPMSSLIQRCINRDHRHRPTMTQILDELKLLNV